MYCLGKIVGSLVSPVGVALTGFVVYLGLLSVGTRFRHGCTLRRIRKCVGVFAICWIWFWAVPFSGRIVGVGLEREFLVSGKVPQIDSYPNADAILLLGGSMGADTNFCDTAEMWSSADRVWQAARLFKAGKANKIVVTGGGVEASTKSLLLDFGVPADALVFDEAPRNTEEEARAAAARGDGKVLVVTSAWHMKRAMMMFGKYAPAVEAIPAPADFENAIAAARGISFADFIPSPAALSANSVSFHEWLGIWAHMLLR